MTKEAKVEVELHDEDINDIVEETLEEETVEEAAELTDKGKDDKESEKTVKDAESAVRNKLLLLKLRRV